MHLIHPISLSLCVATMFAAVQAVLAQPGLPPSTVAVSPIVEREVEASQTFVGTVMPLKQAIIGSAVDGRVIEFPLDEGDRVESGQMLAQLLTETIKLDLAAAEAELELRKQELAELVNGTRPEEIEQARARMTGAEARAKYANARRQRAETLFQQRQALSEEERDEAIAQAVEAEQAYQEAIAAHQLAVQGPRKEQIARAKAQVAVQQATADRLKDQIAKHTIISRFDGYVVKERTEVGAWVKQGDPVAEVAALDEMEVVAAVVEQYAPFIRRGMAVRIQLPSLPGQTFQGVVSSIVPQADVQARTFPVKVRVKNQVSEDGPVAKSGMYARVLLPTGQRTKAMMVLKDAVVLGGATPVVFLVDAPPNAKGGKVRPVPVELGVAEGNMIQVSGAGLQPGQQAVVQGNERLRPGQEVLIKSVVAPKEDLTRRNAASEVR